MTALMPASPIAVGGDTALDRLQARHPALAQLVRFVVVGGLSTLLSACLFLVFTLWLDSVVANLIALVLSTVVSTEANRRFTFGGAPAQSTWRVHVQNSGTVLFYAFYSSIVLLLVDGLVPGADPVLESATIATASILGGTLRFLVLRYWVFVRRYAV